MVGVVTLDGDRFNHCEIFDESDLDAALARFDELTRPTPKLENAASRVNDRIWTSFTARDSTEIAKMVADDFYQDDRRRVVNAGIRRGRDAAVLDSQAAADVGLTNATSVAIATRGQRLVIARTHFSGPDPRPDVFHNEALHVLEINNDDRLSAVVVFDVEDVDAALKELDARYLAGEAAPHAHTWSVITGAYAAVNRHELPEVTPDCVNVDRRRLPTLEPGAMNVNLRAGWTLTPEYNIHIDTVHRLSDRGAVVTHTAHGVSHEGFDAEWRMIQLLTVDAGLVNRGEVFDESDLDAALARFDELTRPTRRLENAASKAYERYWTCYAARDWDAMAAILTHDICTDDRRSVVNAGVQQGRDAEIARMRYLAKISEFDDITSAAVATRGERLSLTRVRSSTYQTETLNVVEIDADERLAARVIFDISDIDAAFGELDARYVAGEAAAYAHTFSVIAGAYAALDRREIPATTPYWVNLDHRRVATVAPGDLIQFVRAAWELERDIHNRIETVHRINDFGAAVTRVSNGTSHGGFDAEWRSIDLMTVEGDLISRFEMFDDADIDAALTRFDELHAPPRLQNAASQVGERFRAHFTSGDWDAIAKTLADDFSSDDRRRVVGAGVRHGRDAQLADMRAIADLWIANTTPTVIATRGARLVLIRVGFSDRDHAPEAFLTEVLCILEINADERIEAAVSFQVDDIDAAFEELDARYLAGEAARYSDMWSVVTEGYAAHNRHEIPPATRDWVTTDHRVRATFEADGLTAYVRSAWDLAPDVKIRIETVHRLSELGAVVTHVGYGTSQDGFEAEWRIVVLLAAGGDGLKRCELFDEADIDTALARFDELHAQTRRLENAASRVVERFQACFAARDWDSMAEMVAEDMCNDDRRPVVNAGLRRGRDAEIANLRALVDLGVTNTTSVFIATRGERLALCRIRLSGRDKWPEAFQTEVLNIIEIDADNRITSRIWFDLDDIDAAFEELDARYLAGEAAEYAQTWSVIANSRATFQRGESAATTQDWVITDHQPVSAMVDTDNMAAYVHAVWDTTPDLVIRTEAVHRLSSRAAVITQTACGTSREGFDAEWRYIMLLTVIGDRISRNEVFDEVDLDAALARFEELCPTTPQLENAASRAIGGVCASFGVRDWDAMAASVADEFSIDDRRRVVNGGIRHGRDAEMEDLRAAADAGFTNLTSVVIATRGEHICLIRLWVSSGSASSEGFHADALQVVQISDDERINAVVVFDTDDVDAALAELDARYAAGEAAAYSHTWSVIAGAYASISRREVAATTPDLVSIDHRRVAAYAPGEVIAYIRAGWELDQRITTYIENVHRLTNLGAVVTHAAYGTSKEGFDAEWRGVQILTVEGEMISRSELFDEADLDAALARFEELTPPAPRLENAASRVNRLFWNYFAACDWDAIAAIVDDDICIDDRRRVVNAGVMHGRDAHLADLRAIAGIGPQNTASTVIATRGARLALTQVRSSYRGLNPEDVSADVLCLVEIGADHRIVAFVGFDLDDFDAAFTELDARYLAGEAAAHAATWSTIARLYTGFNRRELPATTPGWVTVDHRPLVTIESGDIAAYIGDVWTKCRSSESTWRRCTG